MEFTLINALGDSLHATPVFRELHRRLPDENLRVFEPQKPEIFKYNPNLNRGNHENGVRMYLNPPSTYTRVVDSYAAQITAKLQLDPPLVVADATPELFLTEAERAEFAAFGDPKTLAINAHAHSSVRRWPYFAELSKLAMRAGWRVYHVGSGDHDDVPCTRSFQGQLTIRQSAALLANVSRVACNDTGIMHLAAAVGTTHVVPFGYVLTARPYLTTRVVGFNLPHESPRCNQEHCAMSSRCAKLDKIHVRQVFSEVVR